MKLRMQAHYGGWWLNQRLSPGDVIEVPDDLAAHLLHQEPNKFEAAPTDAKATKEITLTPDGEAYVSQDVVESRKERLALESQLVEIKDKIKQAESDRATALEETAEALLAGNSKTGDAARKRRMRAESRLLEAEAMRDALERQIRETLRKEQAEELNLLAKEAATLTEDGEKARKTFIESLILALEEATNLQRLKRRASTVNSQMAQLSESLVVPSLPLANVQGLLKGDQVDLDKNLDAQIARLRERLKPPELPAPEPTVKREKWQTIGHLRIPGR